jgi:hypothetical protein
MIYLPIRTIILPYNVRRNPEDWCLCGASLLGASVNRPTAGQGSNEPTTQSRTVASGRPTPDTASIHEYRYFSHAVYVLVAITTDERGDNPGTRPPRCEESTMGAS